MKTSISATLIASALLTACSQTAVPPQQPTKPAPPAHTLALPGQSMISSARTETDVAFDRQVEADARQLAQAQADAARKAEEAQQAAAAQAAADAAMASAPIPEPNSSGAEPSSNEGNINGELSAPFQQNEVAAAPQSSGKTMNYNVRINNATTGRIFIEAQDDAGTIYPCGFMPSGKSYNTKLDQAEPISGGITVVVRDPDKDGAPEIRRYRIPAPDSPYSKQTVDIKVLPGGNYKASVGSQVYASTPGADAAEAQMQAAKEAEAAKNAEQ